MNSTKKTYFIQCFTLAQIILMISSTALLLSGVLFLMIAYFETSVTTPSHFILAIEVGIKVIYQWLGGFGLITLSLFLGLLLIEVVIRLRHDSLTNLWRSIWFTLSFRRFLHQNERTQTNLDKQAAQSVNPIHKDFNKAVRRCVLDLTDSQARAFIKLPHSQQAQKMLKEVAEQIKEELSSRNPQYYFSAPERIKNSLWFIGTKRD